MAKRVLYPIGYGREMVPMDELRHRTYPDKIEPEFADLGFAWIEAQGGLVGIGGSWRSVQPVAPGFAPPGMSFHETQEFEDGTLWYMAWDLVVARPLLPHRAPKWSEVPKQGSAEALLWGVHANVDDESWHLQHIDIDGYTGWVNAGRRRPTPRLTLFPPTTPPPVVPEPDVVVQVSPVRYFVRAGDSPWRAGQIVYGSGLKGATMLPTRAFMRPFVQVDVPGVTGVSATVLPGEGPYAVLNRMKQPRTRLDEFYAWNGGEDRVFHPGDTVDLPL